MIRFVAALVAFCAAAAVHAQTVEGVLKKIRDGKSVTIAYRTDALPFSYVGNDKQPAGYTVELCKRVVASMEEQLKVKPIAIKWVAATSQNRMELVQKRQADMECGSTTATLSRMAIVDFSNPVFVDTTGLLVTNTSGAKDLGGLAGKRIAVVSGTSNHKAVDQALKKTGMKATVVAVKTRDEGIAALEGGKADAFASDKILLLGLADKVKDATRYTLLEDNLSFEPYGIALPRGESDLRLAVNRGLAGIFAGDEIVKIFRGAFGADTVPTPILLVMYGMGSLPE
jgi:glutamate/aspartate transport system substrate-binding protein